MAVVRSKEAYGHAPIDLQEAEDVAAKAVEHGLSLGNEGAHLLLGLVGDGMVEPQYGWIFLLEMTIWAWQPVPQIRFGSGNFSLLSVKAIDSAILRLEKNVV